MSEFDALCANDAELAGLRSAVRAFLAADRDESAGGPPSTVGYPAGTQRFPRDWPTPGFWA